MQNINLNEMSMEDIIKTFVEVEVKSSDEFLKLRETLTRMGVMNQNKDTLFQSCHILHKRGKYYIVHFKELFALDGRKVDMSNEDYARRNTIAQTLEKWSMCRIISTDNAASPILGGRDALTIIPFKDKNSISLRSKYMIGKKRTED